MILMPASWPPGIPRAASACLHSPSRPHRNGAGLAPAAGRPRGRSGAMGGDGRRGRRDRQPAQGSVDRRRGGGRASKGTILRNLGCTGEGEARWCQVALGEGGVGGWASARYLAPHGAEPAKPAEDATTVAPDPAAGDEAAAAPAPGPAAGDVEPPAAAGAVSCSLRGQPAQSCEAMKRRERGRRARDHRDLRRRLRAHPRLRRRRGRGLFSRPDRRCDGNPRRGKTVVDINGVERIEIPDALIGR